MMRWLLIAAVPLIAIGLGVFYGLGASPGDVVAQLSGKKVAMLEKRGEGEAVGSVVIPAELAKADVAGEGSAGRPAVTVARVKMADFVETVLVTGSLVAREQVLIAPEVEGLRVLSYDAEEGDYVKKGQLLARLEKTTLTASFEQNTASIARAEAAISQAGSGIEEARAVLKEAEAALRRARPLTKSRHISKSVFDQREAAAMSAKARLKSARSGRVLAEAEKAQLVAQRREIAWRLSRCEIRSPVDGLISSRNVRIGEVASASKQPMFKIVTEGDVELNAEVDARNLVKIRKGQSARVRVVGQEPLPGTVRLVSPQVDEITRLGHARILVGRNPSLKIGAFARANVDTARSTGLSVPVAAVLYRARKAFVLRVEGNQIRLSPVKIGLQADGLAEIVKGLSRGDRVVFKSGTFLRDGDFIRPIEPVAEARRKQP